VGAVAGVHADLSGLRADVLLGETDALGVALRYLHERTKQRVPVLDGDLRDSSDLIKISPKFGGVTYPLIYARKQEERDWQKHPHGGQAHFVAETWDVDMDEALNLLIDAMTAT
jgi:hypothetical protein